jgi:Trypsin-like peptidase domain
LGWWIECGAGGAKVTLRWLLKLQKHGAFARGYPTLSIAEYSELHEMMEIGICGFPLGEALHDQLGTVTSSFTKGMISSIIPALGIAREHVKGFQLDATATNGNSGGPVFSLATGKVFGVLQSGARNPNGYPLGLTKAEPVYPVFENDLVARMAAGIQLPSDFPNLTGA